ncbi:MAG: hypothetical protein Q9209_007456 [Squamulea sp. 1 TL-2023]
MPMAIYTWLLIASLCPLPIRAGPLSFVSLSPYLSTVVPACAHACLRSFLADSFPSSTCKSQSDIRCLCTQDSKTGFTLGEGALRCLAAQCGKDSTAISAAAHSVYDVCSPVPERKPKTHPTLTATQVVVTTVSNLTLPTSTMSTEDSNTQPAIPTRTRRRPFIPASATRGAPIRSGIVVDTSILTTPSSTASNIPSTTEASLTEASTFESVTSLPTNSQSSRPTVAAAASAPHPVLTKPEIAGVTVGSVAAAGIVFGLLALCFCLRGKRNKKRRGSDASFGNDKIVVDEPRAPSPPRSPEISEPYDQHAEATSARPQSNNRWSFFRRSMKPEDIGVAVAPGPVQQTPNDLSPITPVSAASYETTSRLLPDKPTYSLYPPPLRLSSYSNHVSPIDVPGTQTIDFGRIPPGPIIRPAPAPRGRGTMDTSQTHLHHGQPTVRHVPSDPFLESTSSDHTIPPRQYQILPTQRPKAPSPAPAPAPAPVAVRYGQWAEPIQVHRKPVPARLSTSNPQRNVIVNQTGGTSALPPHPVKSVAGPSTSQAGAQPVHHKSSSRRKASGKRPATFLSSTSDTSFEDGDSDDEPLPPLPKPVVSPIESTPSRPRAAGVRYPVIPTSAAASPPINQTIREVQRIQVELNPASDRSKGKAKICSKTPSPQDKSIAAVPELAGSPLGERQQVPHRSSDRVKPGSAKWNILVAPGLEGIENVGTPKSKTSEEWTPLSTPTRRGR